MFFTGKSKSSQYKFQQYVDYLYRIGNTPEHTNKLIGKCYYKNSSSLSWSQVKILLKGLERFRNLYHHPSGYTKRIVGKYDDDVVKYGIINNFMRLNSRDISPHTAVEISDEFILFDSRNKLLIEYYFENNDRLSWDDVQIILSGLDYSPTPGGFHKLHGVSVRNRILNDYNSRN